MKAIHSIKIKKGLLLVKNLLIAIKLKIKKI